MLTIAKVMWLGIWRDRGALLLAFIFPPLLFIVFAEVFSGSTGEGLELNIAWADQSNSDFSARLLAATERIDGFVLSRPETAMESFETLAYLTDQVRRGQVDAAILVRDEWSDDLDADPPLLVIGDSSRALALAVVQGRLQGLMQREFPAINVARAVALVDVLAGPYTDQQRQMLDELLAEMAREEASGDTMDAGAVNAMVDATLLQSPAGVDDDGGISYYAGAVAILFLLFSAMQGAISLIDERTSGIVDRLLAGPGGAARVTLGKGLFLTLQGLVQVTIIFAVAWWMYGIDWIGAFWLWLVTAVVAAACSAWLAMLMSSLCSSRQQAQTTAAFLVLILSAIGGSMMPRFLMPGWLRDLGWLTPNAWAIEAWQGVFWRGQSWNELWLPWAVLAGAAMLAMVVSVQLSQRYSRA